MRGLLIVMLVMSAGTWIAGCATTDTAGVTTPADTQPKSYMDTVTDPMNQPQLKSGGGNIRY